MIYHTLFSVSLLALLGERAEAYWRMRCEGPVGVGRMDPIISPGKTSAHVHTIRGGSGFGISADVDKLLASDCSSCEIKQDKSAYWSPQLFFFDKGKNEFELVPEIGGSAVYYKNVPAGTSKGIVKPVAIPNGMQMISGSTFRRNFSLSVPDPPRPWTGNDATQDALEQKAIGFNCLNYKGKPEDTLIRHTMPEKSFLDANCPDGLRLEVLFPICWNGRDLKSPDYKSHLAYSDAGANGGNCPQGYDTVINQLLFETYFPVHNYQDRQGYFALANGDGTGCGYHGDALIAWEPGVQEAATEQCGSDTQGPGATGEVAKCPVFKTSTADEQGKCKVASGGPSGLQNKLALNGPMDKLPGNNPVTFGPEAATPPSGGTSTGTSDAPPVANDLKANPDPAPAPSPPATPGAPKVKLGGEQAGAQDPPAPDPPAPAPAQEPSTTTMTTLTSSVVSSTTVTTTTSPAAVPPPPPPDSPPAGGQPPGQVLSTAYVTQGAQVLEMIYVLEVLTTTVEAPAAAATPPAAGGGGPAREVNEGPGHANAVAMPVAKRALLGETAHEHWTRHVRGARHNHRHGHGHGGLRR